MVEFDSIDSATRARDNLNGCDIYSSCCTLKIDFAKVSHKLLYLIRLSCILYDKNTCWFCTEVWHTQCYASEELLITDIVVIIYWAHTVGENEKRHKWKERKWTVFDIFSVSCWSIGANMWWMFDEQFYLRWKVFIIFGDWFVRQLTDFWYFLMCLKLMWV